jgi:type II secretory pathway pseudopilin PulG
MRTRLTPLVRDRRGYSLGELLLSITITIAVFSAAVPFFTMQMRQLQQDLGRSDAQMTARFAQNTIDRELRNIGIGTTPMNPAAGITRNQPKIVMAGPFAVTFNTDLIASDTSDINAVYYDPNVPLALTTALTGTGMITLPLSSKPYPDFVYRDPAGALSLAETVSYWASVDSTASATDEYVMFRRVNDGPVSVVARGIRIPSGQSLFTYTRLTSTGVVSAVPIASLPVFWDQTNSFSDSIRTVTMSIRGVFHGYDLQNRAKMYERAVTSQTSLANIGLSQRGSCGDVPLNPGAPVALFVSLAGLGADYVEVTFNKSSDEASGENDVDRYAIFRREVGQLFGEPIAVVGKSGGPYVFEDFDLQPGLSFEYGVAAQDCSPANSTILTSNPVAHP